MFQKLINQYFDEDHKLSNLLNNTVEEVLMKEEESYNSLICSTILADNFAWSHEEIMVDENLPP